MIDRKWVTALNTDFFFLIRHSVYFIRSHVATVWRRKRVEKKGNEWGGQMNKGQLVFWCWEWRADFRSSWADQQAAKWLQQEAGWPKVTQGQPENRDFHNSCQSVTASEGVKNSFFHPLEEGGICSPFTATIFSSQLGVIKAATDLPQNPRTMHLKCIINTCWQNFSDIHLFAWSHTGKWSPNLFSFFKKKVWLRHRLSRRHQRWNEPWAFNVTSCWWGFVQLETYSAFKSGNICSKVMWKKNLMPQSDTF